MHRGPGRPGADALSAADARTPGRVQGRAINPITKTNWEGVGVEPHVKVPAEQALDTARREAIKAIAERRDKAAVSH